MARGRKRFCPACGRWLPAHGFTEGMDMCPTCRAEEDAAGDVVVSGAEVTRLREAAGMTLEDLAALVNTERSTYKVDAADLDRLENSPIHVSFVRTVERLLKERTTDMADNDIREKTAEARQAHDAYLAANAEAETLAQDFDAALDRLMALGEPLAVALKERRRLFYAAVSAERARARAAGEDTSRVDSINYKAWRRNVRVPAGVINLIELTCEYAVIDPGESDDTLSPARAVAYLDNPNNQHDGVPFDAKARRRARAGA